jgi:hypothetical protein
MPLIRSIQAAGATSLRQIAAALNDQNVTTVRGGEWSAVQVQQVITAARWQRPHRPMEEATMKYCAIPYM